jgi:hypothetical protein
MAIKKDLKPVIHKLKQDSRFKKLKNVFDSLPVYQIPIDTLMTEVESAHKMRSVRRLSTSSSDFMQAVVDANIFDQTQRSRMAEIQMTCLKATNKLQSAITALKDHLILAYAEELKVVRTKEERTMIVNAALRDFNKYIDRVSILREMTQIVISDIDKAGWSLSRTIDALSVLNKPERTI